MEKRTKQDGSLVIHGESWADIGFHRVNPNRGDTKHKGCPVCIENGKDGSSPDVSINGIKGYGHCFSCGTKFAVGRPRGRQDLDNQKDYVPPKLGNVKGLSEQATQYLRGRGITSGAITVAKLVEENGNILFPYIRDEKLVNVKYRGITEKSFRQAAGAMPIMYLYDFCKGKKKIIVCEGEFDALSYLVAILDQGLEDEWGVTSVNAGAPNEKDKNVDKKLECVTNSIDLFEDAELIYISVDDDENGHRLKKELIRRFDEEKVRIVDLQGVKDANQYLLDHNHLELLDRLTEAVEYVPEGISTAGTDRDLIHDAFENGFAEGSTTYFPSIDERWKLRTGDVTLFTGYNNDGKSAIVQQIATLKGQYEGWKTGIWSPENLPRAKFWLNQAWYYVGKPFTDGPSQKMTREELDGAISFYNNMFFLVDSEDGKLDTILSHMKYLIRIHGIRIVIIDPYNQIEHEKKYGETIDEYVSRFMTVLKKFAVKYDVAVIVVAHQNPPKTHTSDGNYPRPDKYNIKNGGTFSDKTDHVIAVHRPYYITDPSHPTVDIGALKLKDIGLVGEIGWSSIDFHKVSHRYFDPELGHRSPFTTIKSDLEEQVVPQYEQAMMFEGTDEEGQVADVPF